MNCIWRGFKAIARGIAATGWLLAAAIVMLLAWPIFKRGSVSSLDDMPWRADEKG